MRPAEIVPRIGRNDVTPVHEAAHGLTERAQIDRLRLKP
jgi:hypothetical protein